MLKRQNQKYTIDRRAFWTLQCPVSTRRSHILKGCVRYIFTSLFFISKREHLWNKEKCFLFHFESSFRSWDNQILTFQIFKCHDVIKYPSINTKHIYWITWEVKTVWQWNLASLSYYKIKFFFKNSVKNVAWKLV